MLPRPLSSSPAAAARTTGSCCGRGVAGTAIGGLWEQSHSSREGQGAVLVLHCVEQLHTRAQASRPVCCCSSIASHGRSTHLNRATPAILDILVPGAAVRAGLGPPRLLLITDNMPLPRRWVGLVVLR
jgi:hypothetical protein